MQLKKKNFEFFIQSTKKLQLNLSSQFRIFFSFFHSKSLNKKKLIFAITCKQRRVYKIIFYGSAFTFRTLSLSHLKFAFHITRAAMHILAFDYNKNCLKSKATNCVHTFS
ncbi:hypothetical protein BpHYR1_011509 [Brachionus plicatilis]|uniref:Uncharacterized protein n=1 Tax=Brachionus plicatilis TaxID=10195 RepID=A0A3M7S4X5_BRAPC|nr:hypothetical protein BpHYR1_011509 [Brachionus plicatilis]